ASGFAQSVSGLAVLTVPPRTVPATHGTRRPRDWTGRVRAEARTAPGRCPSDGAPRRNGARGRRVHGGRPRRPGGARRDRPIPEATGPSPPGRQSRTLGPPG